MLPQLQTELRRQADPQRAATLQRFFKTGLGEYAEGDKFIGLTVPQIRLLVREYRELPFGDACRLLRSPIHEERLLALLLFVEWYRRGDERERRRIYGTYLRNTRYVNNWDLVDSSAEHIVGAQPGAPLMKLARSANFWERRIAVIATFHFIKRGEFRPTLRMARQLLREFADRDEDVSRMLTRLDPAQMKEWSERPCVISETNALELAQAIFNRLGFRQEEFEPPEVNRYRWQPSETNPNQVLWLPAFHVRWLKKGYKGKELAIWPEVEMVISGTTKKLIRYSVTYDLRQWRTDADKSEPAELE